MSRAVLFDLEGTLVDVGAINSLREGHRWREYVASVTKTRLYPGMLELLESLRAQKVKIGVVTNVPSMLAEAVVRQHGIAPDVMICYHDVPRGQHKPHPAMCEKALQQVGVLRERAIGVGDRADDFGAFHSAGLPAYCAGWNEHADRSASWDAILLGPSELLDRLAE